MKYTKVFLEKRAKLACELVGLTYGEHYIKVDGVNQPQHDNVCLVENTSGWDLEQLCHNSTGVRSINGNYNSLTKSEMAAFLDGMLAAQRLINDGDS